MQSLVAAGGLGRSTLPAPGLAPQLTIYREQIKAIALAHHVTNVRVFGSTARGEDTSKSDLDLLVSPIEGETGLMELVTIEAEIKKLIKIPVDVVLDTEIPEEHRDRINGEQSKYARQLVTASTQRR